MRELVINKAYLLLAFTFFFCHGFLRAESFNIDKFAEFVSPEIDSELIQTATLLDGAGIGTLSSILILLEGNFYTVRKYEFVPSEFILLEYVFEKQSINNFDKKNIDSLKLSEKFMFAPGGVFSYDKANNEFARDFSKSPTYPQQVKIFTANNQLLTLLQKRILDSKKIAIQNKEHIKAAHLNDLSQRISMLWHELIDNGSIDFDDDDLVFKSSLDSQKKYLQFLEFKVKALGFELKVQNSISENEHQISSFNIFDPLYQKQHFISNKDDSGLAFNDGFLKPISAWSKYLYENETMSKFFKMRISKINNTDISMITHANIKALLDSKEPLIIEFSETNGLTVAQEFKKYNPLEISIFETARDMNFNSANFFKK